MADDNGKKNIVFLDRDGTVNWDEDLYLGSQSDWREQIKIMDGVVEGIKLLNLKKIPVFIVTNQAGVAIQQFPELTERKMHEVNKCIIGRLGMQGARIEGYAACPFVEPEYAEKVKSKGWTIYPSYVKKGHQDIKPRTGMLEACVHRLNLGLGEINAYVIGDRASDVQLGLNANGTGILVPSWKTAQSADIDKVRKLEKENPGRVYIAESFLDAVNYVKSKVA